MPVRTKKNKTKSTPKNKSTSKSTARRRKKKSHIKRNIFILLALLLMITLVIFGFYLGKNSENIFVSIQNIKTEKTYTTQKLLEDLSKTKQVSHLAPLAKPREEKNVGDKNVQVKNTQVNKPRLVIIIDDVSKKEQINAMNATGLKLTPAIFPPSKLSMTSHYLAKGLKHAMIHLPMESGNKQFNKQYKTLFTHFSISKIETRVKELRKLFPKVRYVNNHTGSVFTQDNNAMKKLYSALRKEDFIFIDSRTASNSKVGQIAHSFGDVYMSRDVFIDNIHNVPYIHKQLQKVVDIAKKKGHAIAIGHPHKVTMKALKSAHKILRDVELVYMDSIYRKER